MCGGKVNVEARFVEPTVILNPDMNSELMTDEIFGPVIPIISFLNLNEVIKFVNARPKPLAVYYFGKHNGPNSIRLMNETRSGQFVTNDCIF